MANLKGPEGKNILGNFVEDEVESFFSNFVKWNLLYRNVDVKSLLHIDEEKEENRGFDFIYQLYEPFESGNHGIIIESKKIESTELFTKNRLSKDIDSLKHKIENASKSKELLDDDKVRSCSIHYFKYGILCYRFKEFNEGLYRKTLKEYKISETKKGKHFPTVFILSNDRLSSFVHLKRDISTNSKIKYYYPYYNANQWMKWDEKLSLFYLFSDIIPFEIESEKCLLSFDEPSPKSFNLIENFCGKYNHDLSKLILANCDYQLEHIYSRFKADWETRAKKTINLSYLDGDLNISVNLAGIFKHE